LDETSGTVAFDSIGGNNGVYSSSPTLNQASLLRSGLGKSVLFNNNNLLIDPLTISTSEFTVDGWVRLPTLPTRGIFFSIGLLINGGSTRANFSVGVGSGTIETNGTTLIALSEIISWYSSSSNLTTKPFHVAIRLQALQLSLFLNGTQVLDTNTNGTNSLPASSLNRLSIGTSLDTQGRRLINGFIDEVAVYDYPLSNAQIMLKAGINF
jgi:Concanavalin A-like lectin/glucanases superfamily